MGKMANTSADSFSQPVVETGLDGGFGEAFADPDLHPPYSAETPATVEAVVEHDLPCR